MRLYPTVPTSVPRLTPPEGIEIAGKFIPGGTTVIVPRYSIARRTTRVHCSHKSMLTITSREIL